MTGTEVNSEFCFLDMLNVSFSEAEGNIEGRWDTKLAVSQGNYSLSVLLYLPRQTQRNKK
jgi:hypothetical protein